MHKKPSRLGQVGKVLFLGAALHFCGCGALQVSYSDELVRRRGVVAPEDFDLDGRLSRANGLLMDFPTAKEVNQELGRNIIKSMDRYLTPGARYLLVHVRDVHDVENSSEEDKKEVMAVQNDIYQFLDYLIENPHIKLKRVYAEVYIKQPHIDRNISSCRFLDYIYRGTINELEEKIKVLKDGESIEKKRKQIRSLKQAKEELIISYGVAIKLGAEGKLMVLPAEKFESTDEIDLSKKGVFYAKVDNRENEFLEIVSKQKHPLVVITYGGLHAWGGKSSCGTGYGINGRLSLEDNIADYNAEHPNKKFSLVEVTVDSYQETSEKYIKLIMDSLH